MAEVSFDMTMRAVEAGQIISDSELDGISFEDRSGDSYIRLFNADLDKIRAVAGGLHRPVRVTVTINTDGVLPVEPERQLDEARHDSRDALRQAICRIERDGHEHVIVITAKECKDGKIDTHLNVSDALTVVQATHLLDEHRRRLFQGALSVRAGDLPVSAMEGRGEEPDE